MTVRPLLRAALLTAVLTGVAAPPAHAAAPASAQRFADAALRLAVDIKAARPAIERSYERATLRTCGRALLNDPARFNERASLLAAVAVIQPLVIHSDEPTRRLVAALDAIETNDPALRSGRAAWRASVDLLEQISAAADKPCALLARWAKAGFRDSAAPRRVDFRALGRLASRSDALGEKLERAARRLRRLGVAKGAAERFTGDPIFEDIIDEQAEEGLFSEL